MADFVFDQMAGDLGADLSGSAVFEAQSGNQILISGRYSAFRSAWSDEYGKDSVAPAVYLAAGVADSPNYCVESDVVWLGPYEQDGQALDQPLVGVHSKVAASALQTSISRRPLNETGTNNNPAGGPSSAISLLGRYEDGNGYQAMLVLPEGTVVLYRVVDGVRVQLGTGVIATTQNLPIRLQLRMVGTQISLLADGVSIITAVDATHAGIGRAGIHLQGGSSPVRGGHVGGFRVHKRFGAALTKPVMGAFDTSTFSMVRSQSSTVAGATAYRFYCCDAWHVAGYVALDFPTIDVAASPVPAGHPAFRIQAVSETAESAPSAWRAVYAQFDGGAVDGSAVITRFDVPMSLDDIVKGRICSVSGFWFPGRRIRYKNGVPVGDVFYKPDPRSVRRQ